MNKKFKGAIIAAAAAGFFSAASAQADNSAIVLEDAPAKVKCSGINECKGKGSCHTATNECAGKNGCKGKGWVKVSAAECTEKGGSVVEE